MGNFVNINISCLQRGCIEWDDDSWIHASYLIGHGKICWSIGKFVRAWENLMERGKLYEY